MTLIEIRQQKINKIESVWNKYTHLLKFLKNINWTYLSLVQIFKELEIQELEFYITRDSSFNMDLFSCTFKL